MNTIHRPTSALFAAACMALSGCTAVKPLVCTFTYPIDNIRDRLHAADEADRHEQLPPVLVFAAAPVVVPLRFVSEAVVGCVGGLFSGFASDLNVIVGNASSPTRNLTKPFRDERSPHRVIPFARRLGKCEVAVRQDAVARPNMGQDHGPLGEGSVGSSWHRRRVPNGSSAGTSEVATPEGATTRWRR